MVVIGEVGTTDITEPDGTQKVVTEAVLHKADKPYDLQLLGVVSTEPGFVLGASDTASDSAKRAVALAGRVPVKISRASAPIMIGDALTSSSEPGKAMKATEPGQIIGKALEPWDPLNGGDRIMVFVNLGWYDPGIRLTDAGELDITAADPATDSATLTSYRLTDTLGNLITRATAYASATIAHVKAGLIEAKELAVDGAANVAGNLFANKIISPTVETDKLVTDFISPLADNGAITIEGPVVIAPSHPRESSSATPGSQLALDVQGTLVADRVVTDELIAGKIKAGQIEGLREKIADLAQKYRDQTLSAENLDTSDKDPNLQTTIYNLQTIEASASANLRLDSVEASFGFFSDYLAVLGQATITDLKVTNSLNLNDNLLLTSNSISSLDNTLYLQPSGVGAINLLAGLMTLDASGNVVINGNLTVTGNLIAEKVTANQGHFEELLTQNLVSTGSASFKEVTTEGLVIATATSEEATASSSIATNATAGKATLPAGLTEFTVFTPHVSADTLTYVTPIGDPQNQVLYVLAKKEKEWFKVAINKSLPYDLEFNWWIIRLEPQ
ncbi:hypothetical protein A3J22_03260 [Candidatus Beckwithbacteria bacterium RIFCSPLOWO2_02_FULL_49_12]|nr:MAG: hypothetical protein A3K56_03480 [Candidatus Beckwithbacteria bacterium RIFCSPHIGHO2_12_FULL_49_13]OGD58758.1 MAG: hypothetical protein A3J22_03260 [Candidatus Beckwithbacteria bacterium RIFCSPLOWO2_02_FULL_49_12]